MWRNGGTTHIWSFLTWIHANSRLMFYEILHNSIYLVTFPWMDPKFWNKFGTAGLVSWIQKKLLFTIVLSQTFFCKFTVTEKFLIITGRFSVVHNISIYWFRIKLTGPCQNALRTFPIDQQRCMLFYESFNHNAEQVNMVWKSTPILILKENITLPDYILVDFKASLIKRLYPPGIFNELVATFTFQRLYGFYILQVYSLSTLYVFISWVSFYLGPNNIPSRTTVGVNSLLALTWV